jgi:hypothetical protein
MLAPITVTRLPQPLGEGDPGRDLPRSDLDRCLTVPVGLHREPRSRWFRQDRVLTTASVGANHTYLVFVYAHGQPPEGCRTGLAIHCAAWGIAITCAPRSARRRADSRNELLSGLALNVCCILRDSGRRCHIMVPAWEPDMASRSPG